MNARRIVAIFENAIVSNLRPWLWCPSYTVTYNLWKYQDDEEIRPIYEKIKDTENFLEHPDVAEKFLTLAETVKVVNKYILKADQGRYNPTTFQQLEMLEHQNAPLNFPPIDKFRKGMWGVKCRLEMRAMLNNDSAVEFYKYTEEDDSDMLDSFKRSVHPYYVVDNADVPPRRVIYRNPEVHVHLARNIPPRQPLAVRMIGVPGYVAPVELPQAPADYGIPREEQPPQAQAGDEAAGGASPVHSEHGSRPGTPPAVEREEQIDLQQHPERTWNGPVRFDEREAQGTNAFANNADIDEKVLVGSHLDNMEDEEDEEIDKENEEQREEEEDEDDGIPDKQQGKRKKRRVLFGKKRQKVVQEFFLGDVGYIHLGTAKKYTLWPCVYVANELRRGFIVVYAYEGSGNGAFKKHSIARKSFYNCNDEKVEEILQKTKMDAVTRATFWRSLREAREMGPTFVNPSQDT